jgi:hypothetical protein
MNGDSNMYIVGVKAEGELNIVMEGTTRKKLFMSVLPYPENDSHEEKIAWYQTNKKALKLYKTYGRANNMAKHIESRYNVDYCEVIALTDDIVSNKFDGCPNCGSFDVIEESTTHRTRPLSFDKSDMSFEQTDYSEIRTGEIIDSYECAKCGEDLSDFNFGAFTNDKTPKYFQ